ncbi:MAG: methyltransferase domain-containing protein [Planctomycetes bacterium]|nr:methyltransferase domain-containing protein [Planctomycetota bacterium]
MAGPPPRFNCGEQSAEPWLQRAAVAADLLASLPVTARADAVLADIGCGDQKLERALRARGLPIRYRGYDLHPQASAVQRFDLATQELPGRHDVAVLLGVIEYLPAVADVVARLARQVPALLVSHVVRDGGHYDAARLRELGWQNHLTSAECEAMLADAGLRVFARRHTADRRTVLFLGVADGGTSA